ncbi:hypothetical protein LTR91_017823 [Friedmanniomyces endolithicus]|uniref:rRNA methyltransferase 1, mitochondrial n=1 Tax=Friedmanniomyces endolithicus TaxID=329885 RepID=A0AAN6K5F8_9PEZI|nr:hypothetical protein LTS09_004298 [Friedmanniomyces endolithicus]KAK0773949.1 hypothetical protein LTR75_016994 [Friedmanniomyces endolithicus]KAK0844185.1 hypothetical protein LTR03_008208 [Friedmanniomyces endolithicus]KAK0861324.1 hypothetical protein LTR87_017009 [Friedmanniomyces endolithicus]KAK0887827.1 hypothetical protein LTR02_016873 [Friedmanniomyces endolithicus]
MLLDKTLYVELYQLVKPRILQTPCHCRFVSTTSAINRGLKASRGGSGSVSGRRDGGRDERRPSRDGPNRSARDTTGKFIRSERGVDDSRRPARDVDRRPSFDENSARRPYGEDKRRSNSGFASAGSERGERRTRAPYGDASRGADARSSQRRTRFDTSTLTSAAPSAFGRGRASSRDDDGGRRGGSGVKYGERGSRPSTSTAPSAFTRNREASRDDQRGDRGGQDLEYEDHRIRSRTSSFAAASATAPSAFSRKRAGFREEADTGSGRDRVRSEYGQRDSRMPTSTSGSSSFGRPRREDRDHMSPAPRSAGSSFGRDRAPSTPHDSFSSRSSPARNAQRSSQEDAATVQLNEAFTTVRQIAESVGAIQSIESNSLVPRPSKLAPLVADARQKIAELNEQFPETSLGDRGSPKKEVVFYLRRVLEAKGLFRRQQTVESLISGGGGAEGTMVVEMPGHSFMLVTKGDKSGSTERHMGRRDANERRREDASTTWQSKNEDRGLEDVDAAERTSKQESNTSDPAMLDLRRIRELLWALRAPARNATTTEEKEASVTPDQSDEKVVEIRGLLVKLGFFRHMDVAAMQRVSGVVKKGNGGFRLVTERTKSGAVERVVFRSKADSADVFELGFWKPVSSRSDNASTSGRSPQRPDQSEAERSVPEESVLAEMNEALEVETPRVLGPTKHDEPVELETTPTTEDDGDHPVSVPYTTAASEFIYGTNVVLAALRTNRRKLYRLHIHPRLFGREGASRDIISLAEEAGVPIGRNAELRLLDKLSDSRPHNGVVLEASRLPAPPVLAMGTPDQENNNIPLVLATQSAEDTAVNGAPASLPLQQTRRHPFILMLDGIVDPGNVGNILRTAHFYGADAVAIATATCCSLTSAVLAKASSGACEAVPLLALPRPSSFVVDSAKAGWQVYAAVAPDAGDVVSAKEVVTRASTSGVAAESPLRTEPIILMLGAEGEGLRANLTRQADCLVSIEREGSGERAVDVGVDSLNVSVAAGVLMEAFLRRPQMESGIETAEGSEAPAEAVAGGGLGF